MKTPIKPKHGRMIIALGRPTHFLFTVMDRERRACGAVSGTGSTDKSKVDCLQCRKTVAFKTA